MTRRKVTMLEAFQDSARTSQERRDAALSRNTEASNAEASRERTLGAEDRLLAEEAPAPGVTPSVHDGPAIVPVDAAGLGGGEAPAEAPSKAAARERGASKRPSTDASPAHLTLPFSVYGFVALQCLLLAGAFMLGRQFEVGAFGAAPAGVTTTAGEAELGVASFGLPDLGLSPRRGGGALTPGSAQTGEAPSSAATAAPAGPSQRGQSTGAPVAGGRVNGAAGTGEPVEADPDTAADRAFLDPAMRFTVLAITYSGTPANEGLAWETYDLLAEHGFPVVKPLQRGARIFLHVGAAASISELEALRDRLQNLRVGPRQTPDFRKAYVVNLNRNRD